MARETAVKLRIDAVIPCGADIAAFGEVLKKIEKIKSNLDEMGFTTTRDVSAKMGSYDFGDDAG